MFCICGSDARIDNNLLSFLFSFVFLCFAFSTEIVFIADWWSDSKLYVYVDEEVRKKYLGNEHALLLMNHTYEIDWLVGWMLCEKVGVLGNCKAYAKKAISYIPAVGWAWKFAEFCFLDRSFDKDKEIIGRQISEIFDYPDSVWVSFTVFATTTANPFINSFSIHLKLLLNAEGTRFTEKKHEASVQFARERGMTELKHHLIPRTKGFIASLKPLKAKCQSILDIQLAFKKSDTTEPTVGNLLHGRPVTGYMYVRRIDMNDVPADETAAAEWMQELFRHKDRLQDSFHTHGDFFTGTGLPRIEPHVYAPTIGTIGNTIFWSIVTVTPIVYYLIKLLFSGELLYFSLGVAIITVCKCFVV